MNAFGSFLGIIMTALGFLMLEWVGSLELTTLQQFAAIIVIGALVDFVHRLIYTWIGFLTEQDKKKLNIDAIERSDLEDAQDIKEIKK